MRKWQIHSFIGFLQQQCINLGNTQQIETLKQSSVFLFKGHCLLIDKYRLIWTMLLNPYRWHQFLQPNKATRVQLPGKPFFWINLKIEAAEQFSSRFESIVCLNGSSKLGRFGRPFGRPPASPVLVSSQAFLTVR